VDLGKEVIRKGQNIIRRYIIFIPDQILMEISFCFSLNSPPLLNRKFHYAVIPLCVEFPSDICQIHVTYVRYMWYMSDTCGTCQIHVVHVRYMWYM